MSAKVQNVSYDVKPNCKSLGKVGHTNFTAISQGFSRVQLLGFVALAGLLFGVIFLLPNAIEPTTVEQIAANTTTEPEEEVAPPPPDSPWSDAQLAKQRREAQETLSEIIDIQETLEDKKVKLWAEQAFTRAMETAANGDELYRTREFEQAQSQYRDSLGQFRDILAQVDVVFDQQISQGNQAIDNSQPRQAVRAFELANQLKPVSTDAQQGLARAKVQSQVIDLVSKGKHQLKTGKLQAAKQSFEQALSLDRQSTPAQEQLGLAKTAIIDDNFANAMSEGYAAINNKQYEQAISAFNQASKIKPNMKDAAQALEQAKNKDLLTKVQSALGKADKLAGQEQWQQAKTHYDQALALDPSVIKAKIGQLKTEARAKLDSQLTQAITNPQRLSDSKGFATARAVYLEAKKIKQPGSKLTKQLNQLNQLFVQMSQSITVQIKSNNQTLVTLYRVGSLGSFADKQMDLKPGKYTLVGTRQGYRDVRTEFTLEPGKSAPTVTVQCDEKISNG